MSMFDSYSRDQLRQAYADAWRKHLTHSLLTPLEALIVDVIGGHPEYQAMLRDQDSVLKIAPDASGGAEKPFLHMGLHLAVREQVSIDRPPGVRDVLRQLQGKHGDPHQ